MQTLGDGVQSDAWLSCLFVGDSLLSTSLGGFVKSNLVLCEQRVIINMIRHVDIWQARDGQVIKPVTSEDVAGYGLELNDVWMTSVAHWSEGACGVESLIRLL